MSFRKWLLLMYLTIFDWLMDCNFEWNNTQDIQRCEDTLSTLKAMQEQTPTPALERDISRLEKEIELYSQEKLCYEAQILRVRQTSLSLSLYVCVCVRLFMQKDMPTNDFDILWLLEVELMLWWNGDLKVWVIMVEGGFLLSLVWWKVYCLFLGILVNRGENDLSPSWWTSFYFLFVSF